MSRAPPQKKIKRNKRCSEAKDPSQQASNDNHNCMAASESEVAVNQELRNDGLSCNKDAADESEQTASIANFSAGNECWRERDDGSIPSQDASCDEDQFVIDLEEIAAGRAARMPGKWECIASEQEPSNTATHELLSALQTKAQAFSNKEWQMYWSLHGPSYLATRWTSLYPHIPLEHIETVTGISFLCQSLEEKMNLEEESVSKDETANAPFPCTTSPGGDDLPSGSVSIEPEETSTAADTAANGLDEPGMVCVSAVVGPVEDGQQEVGEAGIVADGHEGVPHAGGIGSELSDDGRDLLVIWNEFYNSTYWHVYHCFTASQQEELETADKFTSDEDSCASQHDVDVEEEECELTSQAVDRTATLNNDHLVTESSAETALYVMEAVGSSIDDGQMLKSEQLASKPLTENACVDAMCDIASNEVVPSQYSVDQSQVTDSVSGSAKEKSSIREHMRDSRSHQSLHK